MNGYIALKAVTFGGVAYPEGATIPADVVLPSRVPALLRTKVIAKLSDINESNHVGGAEMPHIEPKEVEGVNLPIKTEDGVLELLASREDIVKAVETMQMNAEEAEKSIKEIESEDALIIIDACDSRKTVKKAVKERAEALRAEAEQGNNTEGDAATGGDE